MPKPRNRLEYHPDDAEQMSHMTQSRGWELLTKRLRLIERDLVEMLCGGSRPDVRDVDELRGRLRQIAEVQSLPNVIQREAGEEFPNPVPNE